MLLGEILSAEVDGKKSPGILKFVPYVSRAGAASMSSFHVERIPRRTIGSSSIQPGPSGRALSAALRLW